MCCFEIFPPPPLPLSPSPLHHFLSSNPHLPLSSLPLHLLSSPLHLSFQLQRLLSQSALMHTSGKQELLGQTDPPLSSLRGDTSRCCRARSLLCLNLQKPFKSSPNIVIINIIIRIIGQFSILKYQGGAYVKTIYGFDDFVLLSVAFCFQGSVLAKHSVCNGKMFSISQETAHLSSSDEIANTVEYKTLQVSAKCV